LLRLSVITPTLNQGSFIERAIRSVLDQGYGNLEYFVVDGGSSDETVEIIKRYEDAIDWWVSEPDRGQTDALNKGLRRATGDVIAFLNSDDYYLPGAFATAITALETSGASWVAGAAIHVDEYDQPRDTPLGPTWVPTPAGAQQGVPPGRHWLVARPWCVAQPASFWRRSLFERYGEFREDMHFAFDVEFMTRLALVGEEPVLLPNSELAASVLHSRAKSADQSQWEPEYKIMRRAHRRRLSPRERYRLRRIEFAPFAHRLRHAGNRFRIHVIHPLIRFAGRFLDRIPARIRPKIRTRDRM